MTLQQRPADCEVELANSANSPLVVVKLGKLPLEKFKQLGELPELHEAVSGMLTSIANEELDRYGPAPYELKLLAWWLDRYVGRQWIVRPGIDDFDIIVPCKEGKEQIVSKHVVDFLTNRVGLCVEIKDADAPAPR